MGAKRTVTKKEVWGAKMEEAKGAGEQGLDSKYK